MKKTVLYILVSLLPMIFAGCQQLDEVPVNIPTVTTLEADEIGMTTAKIHGEVENMNAIYCYYYFLVSEYSDFPEDRTDRYSFRTWSPEESQGFYADVTDLHEDVTYYYVLCATDGVAEVRGEVLSFRTKTLNISVVTSDAVRVNDDPFLIYLMGTITGAGEGLSSNDIYFMISDNETLTDRYVIYDNAVKYERSTDTYYVQYLREAYEPVYYCLGCRYEGAEILGETKVYYPFDARTDEPYVSKSGGAATLYGAGTHKVSKSYFILSKSSDLSDARLIWSEQWENWQTYPYAYLSSVEVEYLEEGTYYCAYCIVNEFNGEEVIGNVVSFTISSPDLDETVRTGNPFSSSNDGDYQLIGYASICPSDFPNSSFSAYFRCKTDGEDERRIYVENDYAIYRNEDYGLWEFGGWSFDLTRGKSYEYVFCISIDGEEYRGETKTIWTDPVVETLPTSIETLISNGQNSNTRYWTVFAANVSEGYDAYMYISSDRTIVSAWYNLDSACDAGKAVKIALRQRKEGEIVKAGNFIGNISASDKEILGSASVYYYRVYAEAPVSYPNYKGTFSWKPDGYGEILETEEIYEIN